MTNYKIPIKVTAVSKWIPEMEVNFELILLLFVQDYRLKFPEAALCEMVEIGVQNNIGTSQQSTETPVHAR